MATLKAGSILRASVTADAAGAGDGDPAPILVDGADTSVTANGLAHYTPVPGDRLLVHKVGGVVEVLQFLTRGTVPWGGAGGGVSVYRQDTEPTGGSLNEGDIWYDTSDDNHPYVYDGTTWQDARDGTIATAQSTADSAAADAATAQSTADSAATDATTALSNAASAQTDATSALTDVATKTTSTTSTSSPSGTPGDGDEWAQVDDLGNVVARYYGTGGDWAPTEVGPDWLASNLELASHVVAPKHTGTHDWTIDPSTMTLGTVSDSGGSLDGTTYKYQYYVEALMPTGLYAPLSNASDFGQPGTSSGTIDISWTAISGASSYRVWRWRWPLAGGTIQETYRTVTGSTSYTDTSDTGWTTGTNLPSLTSNARVDINPDGIMLYSDENERAMFLSNEGGIVITGQVNFGVSAADDGFGEVLLVQGPGAAAAYPSGEAYIIDHQLFDHGHLYYNIDSADETAAWEMGLYAGAGDDQCAIFFSKASDSDFNATLFINAPRIVIGSTTSPAIVEIENPQNSVGIHRAGDIKWTSDPAYPSGDGYDGWIVAKGDALSRTDYAALFDVIGTTWGAGDGSTTFNIPNLLNRMPIGAWDSGGTTHNVGDTGGAETHTLTTAEMPSHTHGSGSYSVGAHSHGNGSLTVALEYTNTTSTGGSAIRVTDINNQTGGAGTNATASIGGSTADATPGFSGTSGSAGSGSAHSILNPYAGLTPLIFMGYHEF